ncbi:MAG: valine--pyruvate transaminase [Leptospira sp.]|nr:valine--pyruvate transaminase [Leptospira sp.]
MLLSRLSAKISQNNGIQSLMADLSDALSEQGSEISFLGGGNPAKIKEAEDIFYQTLQKIVSNRDTVDTMFGDYSGPIGNEDILNKTAEYLGPKFGANLNAKNIGFFNGSQNAFSFLLNAFSGRMSDGSFKKICLPIVPEYIGYADQTIDEDVFQSHLPLIENISENRFKYKIDRNNIDLSNVGIITISRPTNPTGNVITLDELQFLYQKSKQTKIPLLVDLAYGNPFPNLIGNKKPITYSDGMILSLSFSKIGLPGVRFGIVVANEEVISLLSSFGATNNLSSGNLGAQMAKIFWEDDTLVQLSNNILRPYYEEKLKDALMILEEIFQNHKIRYSIHLPDGGFFLWIHFPDLKIQNRDLYELCKEKQVYIVSGHYFFPGLTETFSHKEKCIRLTYCRAKQEIARGAKIIAQLVSHNCA